jgi:hypothetical protein
MMSICYKEGVKVPPDVLSQLIVAANQDVRQTLHLLSMWAADPAHAHPDALRKDAASLRKDIKLVSTLYVSSFSLLLLKNPLLLYTALGPRGGL